MAIQVNDNNIIDVTPTPVDGEQKQELTKIDLAKVEESRSEVTCAMVALRDAKKQELIASGRMDQLTAEISLANPDSIKAFGQVPAKELSAVADSVLTSYTAVDIDTTSKLVDALIALMKKIDVEEIKSIEEIRQDRAKKKSFFGKLRETAKEKLDKLVIKYQGIGKDMETICNQLHQYQLSIEQTNANIDKMYDASMAAFESLQEYIAAGDQALIEIKQYTEDFERNMDPNDAQQKFKLDELKDMIAAMERRLMNLRSSEAVALQSIPTYQIQRRTNNNISEKIESAFIVTIPAFKTALIQAITAKQQALALQGMSALDDVTVEMLNKSAQNTVTQMKTSLQLTNKPLLSADDIEKVWTTIMTGMAEYKEMEKQYSALRAEESRKIDEANAKYIAQLGVDAKK